MKTDNHLFDTLGLESKKDSVLFRLQEGEVLTYGQVLDRSRRFANALRRAGLESGQRVVVQAEKSVDFVAIYLAAVQAGLIFVPLNTGYTAHEVEYFLNDSQAALFVTDDPDHPRCGSATTLVLSGPDGLAEMARLESSEFLPVERGPEATAALLYTSGTTGRSKGAELTHRNLASNAAMLADVWRFGPRDVLLHALPVYHAHGLFVALNVGLVAGCSLVFLPKFDAREVLRRLPEATVMMGVPTFYTRLLEQPELCSDLTAGIRVFISGSAPLLESTFDDWRRRTGHIILERYGMTETIMSSSNPYDGERIAGTVGKALPAIELRVVDPRTRAPLPANVVGALEVRGPNVFKGYWGMPEKTAETLHLDGFMSTGDLATVDEAGYFRIVGREKDLVISGGLNVYPKEIELEIDALPGVLESAVIGVPHPDFGEAVVAIVVPQPSAAMTEEDVIAALAPRLARFKLPKTVHFVAELPRNAMGKVPKAALRERFARP